MKLDLKLDRIRQKFPNGEFREKHPYYMMDAIQDIPGCLEACLEPKLIQRMKDLLAGMEPKQIFTIGCGTSLNAASAAAYIFRTMLAIPASSHDSMDFDLDLPPGVDPSTMVISISLSGGSLTTCQAQEKARSAGAHTVAVTGNPASRLAKEAQVSVVDPFLDEVPLGKTRSYLSTALLAMLCGMMTKACGEDERSTFLAHARKMVKIIHQERQAWEEAAHTLAKSWSGTVTRYMQAGFGIQKANADEIGLKLIEVLGESATGFALEEFTHGPSASFNKTLGVLLFQSDDRSMARALQVANGVLMSEASLAVITNRVEADWPQGARILPFTSPGKPGVFGLFPAAVIGQYLMYYLAVEKGFSPDLNGNDRNLETGDIFAFFFPPGTH